MPEDLEIGGRERANRRATSSGFCTNIDDCNFHETCDLSSWDENRTVSLLQPPRGEFNLMNYRMSASDFTPPFKVQCIIDDSTPFQIKIEIIVYCDCEATCAPRRRNFPSRSPRPRKTPLSRTTKTKPSAVAKPRATNARRRKINNSNKEPTTRCTTKLEDVSPGNTNPSKVKRKPVYSSTGVSTSVK